MAANNQGIQALDRSKNSLCIKCLGPDDTGLMLKMLKLFGDVFEDPKTYTGAVPNIEYQRSLLGSEHFIAMVAIQGEAVVGALAAYELIKFEQCRKEIYIYDLAVASAYRRQGIATKLISELQKLASHRGAYVIFVQADLTDKAAISLYTKLGAREDVLHFDIPPQF